MNVPVVAAIGTTHSLGFAGLTFAMAAIAAAGGRPVCVVAGVSAQNAGRVLLGRALDDEIIAAQFAALEGADVRAFHVGALLSANAAAAVAAGIARFAGVPAVLDPVRAATGGDALADDATHDAVMTHLVPRAALVTPNLDEASSLLKCVVADLAAMEDAARAFVAHGARAALVKGGHLAGDAVDVLATAAGVRAFASPRIAQPLRGTGDLLAATIATELALGTGLEPAIERARASVRDAIASGEPFAGTRVAPSDV